TDGTTRRAQRNRGLGLVALVYCGYSRSIELDAPIQQLKGLAQPKRSLARVGEEMQITLECPSGGDEESLLGAGLANTASGVSGPHARLLYPAHRQLRSCEVDACVVDAYRPAIHALGNRPALGGVATEHRASEAVRRLVGQS